MLRSLACFWRDSIAAVQLAGSELGLHAAGRLLEVTYESLCADPVVELKRLGSYLGVATPASGDRLPASFDNRNWKAESELTSALAAELTAIMQVGLDRYGYS